MATRGRPRKNPLLREDIVPRVVAPAPRVADGQVKVTCITHDVSLGDGRTLGWQESAFVDEGLAKFLESRGQVKIG